MVCVWVGGCDCRACVDERGPKEITDAWSLPTHKYVYSGTWWHGKKGQEAVNSQFSATISSGVEASAQSVSNLEVN
jgi:hypothetical protein